MKKIALYVNDYYKNNRIFDLKDKVSNRDNCLYHWSVLKTEFEKEGYSLATHDLNSIENSEIVLYNDMPNIKNINKDKKNILILFEPEIIRPDNWVKENHKYFNKIFTWNDEWVDNKKYFKFYLPNKIPQNKNNRISEKVKMCVMISGNKMEKHPNELYSERIKAINWFEKEHLDSFDLYGFGWDRYNFSGRFSKKLNRITFLTKLISPKYPSYRGKADSKLEVLSKYRFAICYENMKNVQGYITEKIFDCFFAGCVPVYWGASDISNLIPEDTFINREKFQSYDELYEYLSTMNNREYQRYLDAIKRYVEGDLVNFFSAENFAKTIVKSITENNK